MSYSKPNESNPNVSLSDEDFSEDFNDSETDPAYVITNDDKQNEILDLEEDGGSEGDSDTTHKRVKFSTFSIFKYGMPNL